MIRRRVARSQPTEKDLREQLKDWGLMGPGAAMVAEAWLKFRNHGIAPYAGGWFDQPEWVRHDFNVLDAVEIFHQIQHDKPDAPRTGFMDAFKSVFQRGK